MSRHACPTPAPREGWRHSHGPGSRDYTSYLRCISNLTRPVLMPVPRLSFSTIHKHGDELEMSQEQYTVKLGCEVVSRYPQHYISIMHGVMTMYGACARHIYRWWFSFNASSSWRVSSVLGCLSSTVRPRSCTCPSPRGDGHGFLCCCPWRQPLSLVASVSSGLPCSTTWQSLAPCPSH